ncbi:MAG: hypothetical protein GX567_06305 [Clostridia bacterium]|nr:hypothetical protein [Clostridia bacterium]
MKSLAKFSTISLEKDLSEELGKLENEISFAKEFVQKAPEGSLRVIRNKKKYL